jgi:hypothetical protein
MSPELSPTQVHHRRPVRGVPVRPRRRTAAAEASASDGPLAINAAPSRGNRPRPLRRWSVAQLVARAVARPSSGGLAH